jgi:3-hydroxyanthranilate 3,4-dioxygenase
MPAIAAPFHLHRFIDENRHLLKPPVGNRELYPNQELIVMIVGGPNSRTDYHIDPGEELFYQLEGDMTLKIIDDGKHRDVEIRAGEMFLLPAMVPHSPQRRADTVGLVVERQRRAGELDAFAWYCEPCGHELHREELALKSISTDLPPIFDRYEAKISNRTCSVCGWCMPVRS